MKAEEVCSSVQALYLVDSYLQVQRGDHVRFPKFKHQYDVLSLVEYL